MNISYRWLQALAPSITESPSEAADRLGMLGAPVDELVDLGAEIRGVVIARVEDVQQHPNADRLRVCSVDAGGAARLQVVCGAPNVHAGGYYPFAPVGASLPGGIEIRKAKLRGEVSEGMLCSARELGLGRDHAGLMTLHGEFEPGVSFVDALGLDDARLVVDVTPNRPDLLSHLGVARDLADGGAAELRLPELPGAREVSLSLTRGDREAEAGGIRVVIEDPYGCVRFLGAVVRGVRVGPSPEWLATRLRAVGLRPINNVVDATNYVLMELGQPLHAYDLAKLAGPEIRARRATSGETLRTLDGVDRALSETMLVIADAERPVGIAGVMGGEESEVTAGTTDVFLECALFDPRTVRDARRPTGLSTDASFRFERGVDAEGVERALRRTLQLIVAVAGGEVAGEGVDVGAPVPERRALTLRPERVERVLGVPLGAGEIAQLLRGIGFDVEEGSPLRVRVPGVRPDVEREIDLIEEVARRRGYDSFAEDLLPFRPTAVPADRLIPVLAAVRDTLARWGLMEARTAGFAPASESRVPLLNPLSAEESHLRDSILPGLLRRVEHNWAHGVRDVRLFETGAVFHLARGAQPREEFRVAAVVTGARRPEHWSGEPPAWDLWDLRGLLAELSGTLGVDVAAEAGGSVGASGAGDAGDPPPSGGVAGSDAPRAAPGGDADGDASGGAPLPGSEGLLEAGETLRLVALGDGWSAEGVSGTVGVAGRVSAGAADAPAWASPAFAFEVRVPASRMRPREVAYRALPEFPASERDLALLTPHGVRAAEVERVLREGGGELLEAVYPFDLYEGKGIPEGTRSVAWRLRFRLADRTLTDAEVDAAIGRTLASLEQSLGVRRR